MEHEQMCYDNTALLTKKPPMLLIKQSTNQLLNIHIIAYVKIL